MTSKHDADCLRRRQDPLKRFLCTCGLTDAQVADAVAFVNEDES